MGRMLRLWILTLALLLQRTSTPQSDWPMFGLDSSGSRFSPLKQITPENVKNLKRAWTYHHAEAGKDMRGSFEVTPIAVDGVLYLSTPSSTIVALEPETGRELWKYKSTRALAGRGVAYWRGDATNGSRILFGDAGGFLVALDVKTGQAIYEVNLNTAGVKFRQSLNN